jgi:NAD(P)-dependent dehydrogenase (short-subunit alcohol dehydrogenase family)
VALIDSRQGELEKQITVLAAKGIEARGFAGQAFRLEEMVRTFADIKEAFGAVDVMAYTPVYTSSARPDEITLEDARKIFERQTVHAIHCVRQVLPDMLARGEGTILLSNSRGVGRPKRFGGSPISSTALLGYGSALRDELAPKGVRVGIVTIDSGHTDKAESWDVANRFWRIHRRRLC